MSTHWYFHALSMPRFTELFGHGTPEQAQVVVDTLLDEDLFDHDEPELAERVARRAVAQGVAYSGLSGDEAEMMDLVVFAVTASDKLAAWLELEPLSPQGLAPAAEGLVYRRATEGGLKLGLLRVLADGGRRHGQGQTSPCEYALFRPDEVPMLRDEVQAIAGLPQPWAPAELEPIVAEELLGPLAAADGRALLVVMS
jgi:hypothetical protein